MMQAVIRFKVLQCCTTNNEQIIQETGRLVYKACKVFILILKFCFLSFSCNHDLVINVYLTTINFHRDSNSRVATVLKFHNLYLLDCNSHHCTTWIDRILFCVGSCMFACLVVQTKMSRVQDNFLYLIKLNADFFTISADIFVW